MSRKGQCDQLLWRGENFFCRLGKVNRNKLGRNFPGETSIIKPFDHPEGISGSTGEIDRSPLISSLLFLYRHSNMKVSLTIMYVNQSPTLFPQIDDKKGIDYWLSLELINRFKLITSLAAQIARSRGTSGRILTTNIPFFSHLNWRFFLNVI